MNLIDLSQFTNLLEIDEDEPTVDKYFTLVAKILYKEGEEGIAVTGGAIHIYDLNQQVYVSAPTLADLLYTITTNPKHEFRIIEELIEELKDLGWVRALRLLTDSELPNKLYRHVKEEFFTLADLLLYASELAHTLKTCECLQTLDKNVKLLLENIEYPALESALHLLNINYVKWVCEQGISIKIENTCIYLNSI